MKFSEVEAVRIPKGSVSKIKSGGDALWNLLCARYVSLGDSIAAGHAIDDAWETNYGTGSQYGVNGNATTKIVPGCYTDLIRKSLAEHHSEKRCSVKSFARSGDRVDDLIRKLSQEPVAIAIREANFVTICIGANDVLEPALLNLERYITIGASVLAEIAEAAAANLAVLADDGNANSYRALFDKLYSINPYATYVFTTIYNPYKYLWIEEGTDGFFRPMLDSIPQITILSTEIDELIKRELINTPAMRKIFSRVNGLGGYSENLVTRLNDILRDKISSYGKANFKLVDAKAVFDQYPDRPAVADVHYNDLVNVEYTRGYDTDQMSWGRLWNSVGKTRDQFWEDLIWKHFSLSGFDMDGFADDLLAQVVEKVIVPDVDPHPEHYGHVVLKQAFNV